MTGLSAETKAKFAQDVEMYGVSEESLLTHMAWKSPRELALECLREAQRELSCDQTIDGKFCANLYINQARFYILQS